VPCGPAFQVRAPRQRLAQGASAEPAGRLAQLVPAHAVAGLQAKHPVDPRPQRIQVDHHRLPGPGGHLAESAGKGGGADASRAAHDAERETGLDALVAEVGQLLDQPGLRAREGGHTFRADREGDLEQRVGHLPLDHDVHLRAPGW
jgi:hypothetical protein